MTKERPINRISSDKKNKKNMQDIDLENPTAEDMEMYIRSLLAEPTVSPVKCPMRVAFRHMTTARGWK